MTKTIGSNIKFYREKAQLSQEQASAKAGITVAHWGNIERGCKNTTIATVNKIARAIGVSVINLIMGIEMMGCDSDVVSNDETYFMSLSAENRQAMHRIFCELRELIENKGN